MILEEKREVAMNNVMISKEQLQDAFIQRHGKELQEKLSKTTVAICGLGGLGSHIAFALARVGIGKLILIDFDKVDISNLHRQQYKVTQVGMYKTDALTESLKEIAPYMTIESYTMKITEENVDQLLQKADIICEAFDDAQAKAMLVNYVLEKMPEKYVIAASGMAGLGEANEIRTKKVMSHFYLCGDEVSEVTEDSSLFASRVMLCAAHQAHVVIQLIASWKDKTR